MDSPPSCPHGLRPRGDSAPDEATLPNIHNTMYSSCPASDVSSAGEDGKPRRRQLQSLTVEAARLPRRRSGSSTTASQCASVYVEDSGCSEGSELFNKIPSTKDANSHACRRPERALSDIKPRAEPSDDDALGSHPQSSSFAITRQSPKKRQMNGKGKMLSLWANLHDPDPFGPSASTPPVESASDAEKPEPLAQNFVPAPPASVQASQAFLPPAGRRERSMTLTSLSSDCDSEDYSRVERPAGAPPLRFRRSSISSYAASGSNADSGVDSPRPPRQLAPLSEIVAKDDSNTWASAIAAAKDFHDESDSDKVVGQGNTNADMSRCETADYVFDSCGTNEEITITPSTMTTQTTLESVSVEPSMLQDISQSQLSDSDALAPPAPPCSKEPLRRTGIAMGCKAPPSRQQRAQDWMNSRLQDVLPEDFDPNGLAFYTTQQIRAPPGFEQDWRGSIADYLDQPDDEAHENVAAILIFCDVFEQDQMALLLDFFETLCSHRMEDETLPTIVVPHSCSPAFRPERADDLDVLSQVLGEGLDSVVLGEPEGFRLASEVRSRRNNQTVIVQRAADRIAEMRSLRKRHEMSKLATQDIVWTYLPMRLGMSLPAIDYDIGPGTPLQLDNFTVGQKLGEGNYGLVFKLHEDGICGDARFALKMTPKATVASIQNLKQTEQQLQVMMALAEWSHPNIAQLHEVIQSKTHIFFVIDYAGPATLYHRLKQRETHNRRTRKALPMHMVQSVLVQSVEGLAHMHLQAGIAHRDLKPENIIVRETPETIRIMITDFDTAKVIERPGPYCRGQVGTFPFTAPEMHLENRYDPAVADIWSLGCVFLEVLCFTRFIEEILGSKNQAVHRSMQQIAWHFERPGAVNGALRDSLRRDLMPMLEGATEFLGGMLNIVPKERWDANAMQAKKQLLTSAGEREGTPEKVKEVEPTSTLEM